MTSPSATGFARRAPSPAATGERCFRCHGPRGGEKRPEAVGGAGRLGGGVIPGGGRGDGLLGRGPFPFAPGARFARRASVPWGGEDPITT